MTAARPGVLFLVNSLDLGGAERQLVTLVNRLSDGRFRVHLAYLKRAERLLPEIDRGALDELLCCDVRRVLDRRALARLTELLERRHIDVVVSTNMYALLYGSLARIGKPHIKLMAQFHTTRLRSLKERLQMAFSRPFFRRCDLLVYVCESQRRYWRKRGLRGRADTVIHNGIDCEFFVDRYSDADKRAIRASFGFQAGDYVIGLCSALRPEKAHGDLLHAIARLRERAIPAKALLIGDGPERRRIEQLAGELNVAEHVRITGLQRDVRPCIASCDVMTLVSHSIETFSLAALESMAMAKPLVMSDIGGACEQVLESRTGYLYPCGDLDALTQRLARLAAPELRQALGAAGAQRVRALYTQEAMVASFAERIGSLAASELLPLDSNVSSQA